MPDAGVLIFVAGVTLLVGGAVAMSARSVWERVFIVGMLAGLFLYSGAGAAYPDVPFGYVNYYLGFLLAFSGVVVVLRVVLRNVGPWSGGRLTPLLRGVDSHPGWQVILWAYIVVRLIPLVYPDIRLGELLAPPPPNLTERFAARWTSQEMDVIMQLVDYAGILLTPLFYMALFRYRRRLGRLVIINTCVVYFEYVATGYIGRSMIAMTVGVIWLALWVNRPRKRVALSVVGVAMVALILAASYYYSVVRIGGTVRAVGLLPAAMRTLESEISFPKDVGVPVIESGATVDLGAYARWMATLPVPKLVTGAIEGARINYEISELVLGVGPGDRGWYVVLPGLVAESVYIYGYHFFWLHGAFVAFLGLILTRLMERVPQLLFLQAYVVVTFAYRLNRAGISGPMSVFVNELMPFYLLLCVAALARPLGNGHRGFPRQRNRLTGDVQL